ncbi:MAG: glycosyltransferase family 4 protein [Planctomycetes bacterium]|nr:glycosyltransferase family 4 protein [Planctomycetota bacterium]
MSEIGRDNPRPGHLALVVGHPARTGGMETFCRFLAETVLAAGWRITVALSGENVYGPLRAAFGERIDIDEVDWIDRACAGDREYTWSRIADRRRWFRRVRPDVAVVVQSSNTPFRCAVVGARLAGVPVVSTHRTMAWPVEDVPSRRHVFGLVPGIGLHRRRVVAKTWLTALLARRVVYNSEEVRREYERLYRYPCRRGVVISNAVMTVVEPPVRGPTDLSLAASRSLPDSGIDAVTIGFVGRIGSDKRLDVLLRAVAAMKSEVPVRVALYGEGAQRASLAELAAELGIANRVEWGGITDDPWSAYGRMDVVVLCSPRESSSNMVLEAMAAGKPVVVTETGGMAELVDRGRCGICVPPLAVDVLTMVLEKLAGNPELRRQLGERARAKAMTEHDPRAIGRQWMSLLSDLAGRRRQRVGTLVDEPRASARADQRDGRTSVGPGRITARAEARSSLVS